MQEQTGRPSLQKELQDRSTDPQIQIECSIDKFELLRASVHQFLHRLQKQRQRKRADGNLKS